ncbi:MAG TPA: phosphatase PAP2 family protein [Candidatus Binatia bacterium]
MGIDGAIQSFVASELKIPAVRAAARFAAGLEVGDQLASLCILFIMAGYLAQKPRLVKTSTTALFALAAGGILVQAFKYLIGRARPGMGLGPIAFIGPHFSPSGFDSFPSGHTTAMFSLLAVFCRFYPGFTVPLYAVGFALSVFARVVTAQHFFTDVIGGAVLGSLVGLFVASRFRGFIESPPVERRPAAAADREARALKPLAEMLDLAVVGLFSGVVLLFGSGLDFTSASFGVLTALAVYFLARNLGGRETALYAPLVLSSCLLFVHVSRTLPADTAWVFFTTLAFTYYSYSKAGGRKRYFFLALAYASIGLGMLARGWPALFAVPVFCFYEYAAAKEERGSWLRRTLVPHAFFLAVTLLVVLPWMDRSVLSFAAPSGDFLFDEVVAKTGLTRRAGKVIYYLPLLAAALFPWSFFAIAYFAIEGKRWIREQSIDPESLLLLAWAAGAVGVFPFVAAASPRTLVLAIPPLACLLAGFIRRDLADSPRALRFSLGATLVTAGALVIAGVVVLRIRPEYASLKLAAPFAVLAFFLVAAWFLRNRRPWPGFFAPLCLGALAFYLSAIVIALAT